MTEAMSVSTPQIPEDFVAGLEGVVAFTTEIAEPDKDGGALRYRGVGPTTMPYLEDLGLVRLDDFADLPTKIGNLVRRLGFKSRDDVITAILAGSFILDRKTVYYRLSPDVRFQHIRNCGPQTFHQIRAWAGFDAPAGAEDAD